MSTAEQVQPSLLARAAQIQNPYWETLIAQVPDANTPSAHYSPSAFGSTWDPKTRRFLHREDCPTRDDLTRQFAWAIPGPLTIAWLAQVIGERSVVEMGAGMGYWAWMLAQMGVCVTAFDAFPPDQAENWFHHEHVEVEKTYTQDHVDDWHELWDLFVLLAPEGAPTPPTPPVVGGPFRSLTVRPGERRETYHEVIMGEPPVLTQFASSVLFLCWPPYGDPMAHEALVAYAGNMLIYCGENRGGCTANDDFFAELDHSWTPIARAGSNFTRWDGMHDDITVFSRDVP